MHSPAAVAAVNGFKCLFAAVLDPTTQDLVEPLISTITYLLEDATTRKYIRYI
jgi:hypothetical protein